MTLNLKRGLLVGLSAATVATGLFALLWYITLPPDFNSMHSIRRWWREANISAHFLLAAIVFGSSWIFGFVMGAFRPTTISQADDKS